MLITKQNTFELAQRYHKLGFSVIPCFQLPGNIQKSKQPLVKWKEYQKKKATEKQLKSWFHGKKTNIAIICGSISDNLLCLDFDHPEVYNLFIKHKPEYKDTATAKTGKGYHVLFKTVEPPPGNWAPFIYTVTATNTNGLMSLKIL